MMSPELIKRFKYWTSAGTGGVVGENAIRAIEYARTEILAEECGLSVRWEPDLDADASWMSEQDFERYRKGSIEAWCAYVPDETGNSIASLGGIFLSGSESEYRREVEAELLSEAFAAIRKAIA